MVLGSLDLHHPPELAPARELLAPRGTAFAQTSTAVENSNESTVVVEHNDATQSDGATAQIAPVAIAQKTGIFEKPLDVSSQGASQTELTFTRAFMCHYMCHHCPHTERQDLAEKIQDVKAQLHAVVNDPAKAHLAAQLRKCMADLDEKNTQLDDSSNQAARQAQRDLEDAQHGKTQCMARAAKDEEQLRQLQGRIEELENKHKACETELKQEKTKERGQEAKVTQTNAADNTVKAELTKCQTDLAAANKTDQSEAAAKASCEEQIKTATATSKKECGEETKKAIADAAQKAAALAAANREVEELKSKLGEATTNSQKEVSADTTCQTKLAAAQKELDEARKELGQAQSAKKALEDEAKNLRKEVGELKSQVAAASTQTTMEQTNESRGAKELKQCQSDLQARAKQLQDAELKVGDAEGKQAECEAKAKVWEDKAKAPSQPAVADTVPAQTTELATQKKIVVEQRAELEKTQAQLADCLKQAETTGSKIKDLEGNNRKLEDKAVQETGKASKCAALLKAAKEKAPRINTEEEQLKAANTRCEDELKQLKKDLVAREQSIKDAEAATQEKAARVKDLEAELAAKSAQPASGAKESPQDAKLAARVKELEAEKSTCKEALTKAETNAAAKASNEGELDTANANAKKFEDELKAAKQSLAQCDAAKGQEVSALKAKVDELELKVKAQSGNDKALAGEAAKDKKCCDALTAAEDKAQKATAEAERLKQAGDGGNTRAAKEPCPPPPACKECDVGCPQREQALKKQVDELNGSSVTHEDQLKDLKKQVAQSDAAIAAAKKEAENFQQKAEVRERQLNDMTQKYETMKRDHDTNGAAAEERKAQLETEARNAADALKKAEADCKLKLADAEKAKQAMIKEHEAKIQGVEKKIAELEKSSQATINQTKAASENDLASAVDREKKVTESFNKAIKELEECKGLRAKAEAALQEQQKKYDGKIQELNTQKQALEKQVAKNKQEIERLDRGFKEEQASKDAAAKDALAKGETAEAQKLQIEALRAEILKNQAEADKAKTEALQDKDATHRKEMNEKTKQHAEDLQRLKDEHQKDLQKQKSASDKTIKATSDGQRQTAEDLAKEQKRVIELTTENGKLKNKVTELEAQVLATNKAKKEATDSHTAKQNEQAAEIAKLTEQVDQLQKKVTAAQGETETVKKALADQKQLLAQMTTQKNGLAEELQNAKQAQTQAVQDAKVESDKLREKIQELEQQQKQLKKQVQDLTQRASDVSGELEKAKAKLLTDKAEHESAVRRHGEEQTALKNTHEKATRDLQTKHDGVVKGLEGEIGTLKERVTTLEAEIVTLKSDLKAAQDGKAEVGRQLQTKTQELVDEKAQHSATKTKLQEMQAEKTGLAETVTRLTGELDTARNATEAAKSQILEQTKALDGVKAQLKALTEQHAQAQEKHEALKRTHETLQQQHDQIAREKEQADAEHKKAILDKDAAIAEKTRLLEEKDKEKLAAIAAKDEEINRKIAEHNDALGKKDLRIAELTRGLQEKQKTLDTNAETIADLRRQLQEKQTALADEGRKLAEKEKQLVTMTEKARVEGSKATQLEGELRQEKEKVTAAKAENERITADLTAKNTVITGLEEKIALDKQALEDKDAIITRLTGEKSKLQADLGRAQTDLTNATKALEISKRALTASQEELKAEAARHEVTKGDAAKAAEQARVAQEALGNNIRRLTTEQQKLQSDLEDSGRQKAVLQSDLEESGRQKGELQRLLGQENQEKTKLSRELRESTTAHAATKKELLESTTAHDATKAENRGLQNKIAATEKLIGLHKIKELNRAAKSPEQSDDMLEYTRIGHFVTKAVRGGEEMHPKGPGWGNFWSKKNTCIEDCNKLEGTINDQQSTTAWKNTPQNRQLAVSRCKWQCHEKHVTRVCSLLRCPSPHTVHPSAKLPLAPETVAALRDGIYQESGMIVKENVELGSDVSVDSKGFVTTARTAPAFATACTKIKGSSCTETPSKEDILILGKQEGGQTLPVEPGKVSGNKAVLAMIVTRRPEANETGVVPEGFKSLYPLDANKDAASIFGPVNGDTSSTSGLWAGRRQLMQFLGCNEGSINANNKPNPEWATTMEDQFDQGYEAFGQASGKKCAQLGL